MNCPNCNYDLENRSICPHCGIDAVLFEKVIHLSNKYYNQGLSAVLSGNLSGAVDFLSKSVTYNKFNFQARNLLGLVYYEIGMVGDALKHWVISAGYTKEDNPATAYIDDIQANSRWLDKLNESAVLYNKALEDLRLKNDDMAIIQLKKSLENNPKFVEACNLLTLCYIYQKSYDKAFSLTEKTLSIDSGNIKALSYHKKLSTGKSKTVVKATPAKEPRKKNYDVGRASGNSFYIAEILTFILGAACAFGIFYMLIMPGITDTYQEKINALNADITEINQRHSDEITIKDEAIGSLEGEIEKLTNDYKNLTSEIELQTRMSRLYQANVYMMDNDYEAAANIIKDTDTTDFTANAIRVYTHVKDTVYPVLEKNNYDEGLRRYNARNYEEAKEFFEKSLEFLTTDSGYVDDNYYFLGRIAEVDDDKDLARLYYERITNDYPNSNQVANARSRLRNL